MSRVARDGNLPPVLHGNRQLIPAHLLHHAISGAETTKVDPIRCDPIGSDRIRSDPSDGTK